MVREGNRLEKYVVAGAVEFFGVLILAAAYVMISPYSLIGIALIPLLTIGITYAWWLASGSHFGMGKLLTSFINGHSLIFRPYNGEQWFDALPHNIAVFVVMTVLHVGGGMLGVLIGMGFMVIVSPPAPMSVSPSPVASFFAMVCANAVINVIYIATTDKRYSYFTTIIKHGGDAMKNVGYINSYYGLAIGLTDLIMVIATFSINFGTTNGIIGFVANIMKAIFDADASKIGPAFFFLGASAVGGLFAGFAYLLYAYLVRVSNTTYQCKKKQNQMYV